SLQSSVALMRLLNLQEQKPEQQIQLDRIFIDHGVPRMNARAASAQFQKQFSLTASCKFKRLLRHRI
ncbi:MAG: hypothetical protein OXN84_05440, partial [Albidovulum sp.]|nr:hypothetical protein [Albidovulum sp.]